MLVQVHGEQQLADHFQFLAFLKQVIQTVRFPLDHFLPQVGDGGEQLVLNRRFGRVILGGPRPVAPELAEHIPVREIIDAGVERSVDRPAECACQRRRVSAGAVFAPGQIQRAGDLIRVELGPAGQQPLRDLPEVRQRILLLPESRYRMHAAAVVRGFLRCRIPGTASAGFPNDHPRRNVHSRRHFLVLQAVDQQPGRRRALFVDRQTDGRERREQVISEVDIVKSRHRHLIGNPDSPAAELLHQPHRHIVVGGDDHVDLGEALLQEVLGGFDSGIKREITLKHGARVNVDIPLPEDFQENVEPVFRVLVPGSSFNKAEFSEAMPLDKVGEQFAHPRPVIHQNRDGIFELHGNADQRKGLVFLAKRPGFRNPDEMGNRRREDDQAIHHLVAGQPVNAVALGFILKRRSDPAPFEDDAIGAAGSGLIHDPVEHCMLIRFDGPIDENADGFAAVIRFVLHELIPGAIMKTLYWSFTPGSAARTRFNNEFIQSS